MLSVFNIVIFKSSKLVEALLFLEKIRIIHLGEHILFSKCKDRRLSYFLYTLDLKPNNIVFAKAEKENLNIKIIDFGLAKDLAEEDDIPISTCGTPEFTSPEVIECGYASNKSDLWSLGVIVYMLTSGGVSPFYCR